MRSPSRLFPLVFLLAPLSAQAQLPGVFEGLFEQVNSIVFYTQVGALSDNSAVEGAIADSGWLDSEPKCSLVFRQSAVPSSSLDSARTSCAALRRLSRPWTCAPPYGHFRKYQCMRRLWVSPRTARFNPTRASRLVSPRCGTRGVTTRTATSSNSRPTRTKSAQQADCRLIGLR